MIIDDIYILHQIKVFAKEKEKHIHHFQIVWRLLCYCILLGPWYRNRRRCPFTVKLFHACKRWKTDSGRGRSFIKTGKRCVVFTPPFSLKYKQ